MRKILPSITSHGRTGSSWRDKISEIEALNLKAVSLFVTGLSDTDRKECYALLEGVRKNHDFSIPFVHAVSSMSESEYLYLIHTFGVEYFNLHPTWQFPLQHGLSPQIRKKILIENSTILESRLIPADMEGFGGICFDLSHLEDTKRASPSVYAELLQLTEQFPVLANHISAVPAHPNTSCHVLASNDEMRYLADLDPSSFSDLCSIELENSLTEQCTLITIIEDALLTAESQNPASKIAA